MISKRIGNALTVLVGVGIIYIGIMFQIDPIGQASGFGLPAWPDADAAGFLNVKGIRDIVTGIAPLTLLVLGHRRALGWVLLAESIIPFGDATIILSHNGSTAIAFGVHFATAVVVLLAGVLQLRAARQLEPKAAVTAAA